MKTQLPLVVLLLATLISTSFAQQPQERDLKKEAAIWEQLKLVAPAELENFKLATIAMDTNKFDVAVKLYEGVMLKAPEFDPVIRRLGICLVLSGKIEEGLGLLQYAVSKNRSPENLISLAQALAYPSEKQQGTKEQKQQAMLLVAEAMKIPAV